MLYSGEEVVVKCVYPEIRRTMRCDLANLEQAAALIASPFKDGMRKVAAEFAQRFPNELDMTCEAANLEYATALIERQGFFERMVVPRVFRDQSSMSVLTTKKLEGETVARMVGCGEREGSKARSAVLSVVN